MLCNKHKIVKHIKWTDTCQPDTEIRKQTVHTVFSPVCYIFLNHLNASHQILLTLFLLTCSHYLFSFSNMPLSLSFWIFLPSGISQCMEMVWLLLSHQHSKTHPAVDDDEFCHICIHTCFCTPVWEKDDLDSCQRV